MGKYWVGWGTLGHSYWVKVVRMWLLNVVVYLRHETQNSKYDSDEYFCKKKIKMERVKNDKKE